jgi:FAD/FMN-containing dehydrogenase
MWHLMLLCAGQADTVLAVKIVDGTGAVRTIRRTDPDFKMLNGGLGLIGIITEMTFKMTPPSNTQLFTLEKVDDKNLASDVKKMFEVCSGATQDGLG